jgi:hypothetical protein
LSRRHGRQQVLVLAALGGATGRREACSRRSTRSPSSSRLRCASGCAGHAAGRWPPSR